MDYAICEISGKQYLVKPDQSFEVDMLGDEVKNISIDKVLLIAEGEKIEIGKPYLKKTLDFEVIKNIKKAKIRVATYKAKANYRRVKGHRQQMSVVQLRGSK